MVEQTVVQRSHGTLLSNQKEWTIDTSNNLHEPQGNHVEWKSNVKRMYFAWLHVCGIDEMT